MLSAVEKRSWLADYLKFSGDNESPRKYHLFVGMVILASILSRRVYFTRMDKVFPNLYVVFVSPPGTGKSTASDIGENLLRRLNPGIRPKLKSGKITPEAFRNWLSRRESIPDHPTLDGAIGTVFADELSVFLGRQRYNEGMVSMLTKIYGCPDVYEDETIAWGNVRLKNVCINLIGTTVDDALVKSVNEDAMLGGFVSRVLWVVGEPSDVRISIPQPLDEKLARPLLDHLISLTNLLGEISFDDDAYNYYDKWYQNHPRTHGIIPGYYERKPTFVIKIAALFQAADYNRRGRIIGQKHIEQAVHVLTKLEKDIEHTVTTITTGKSGRMVDTLYRYIAAHNRPVTYAEITNYCYRAVRSLTEIDNMLAILAARNMITSTTVLKGVTAYKVKK